MVATLRYQVKWPKLDQAHRLVFGRVELQHLLQRELGTNVAVHDDKGIWTPSSDLITEVVEASSCAKRSIFLQISHRHLVQGGKLSETLLLMHMQLIKVYHYLKYRKRPLDVPYSYPLQKRPCRRQGKSLKEAPP